MSQKEKIRSEEFNGDTECVEDAVDRWQFGNNRKRARQIEWDRTSKQTIPEVKHLGYFATVPEALQYLREVSNGCELVQTKRLVGVVWRHQLYALCSDRTEVDQTLDSLCSSNVIRVLNVSASSYTSDIVVHIDDLYNYFQGDGTRKNLFIDLFFNRVVRVAAPTEYTECQLRQSGFGTESLPRLIQHGLLTRTDFNQRFQLSFPGLGQLVAALHRGRSQLIHTLQKAKYHQMLLTDLLRKLNPKWSTGICLELHIYDMIGTGSVNTINVATDLMLQLLTTSAES